MRQAEQRASRRPATSAAEAAWAAIFCVTILAFMPLVPRAGALSLDASPSRIMELALLGAALAAALVRAPPSRLIAVISANAGLALVLGTFALWAALTSIIAGRTPTGIVKAAELASVLLIAFASHADPRLRPASTPRVIVLAIVAATVILLAANIPIYGEILPLRPTEGQSRIRLMLGFNHPLGSAFLLAVGMVAAVYARFSWPVVVTIEALLVPLFLLCDARGISVGLLAAGAATIWLAARPVARAAMNVIVLVAAAAMLIFLALQETYLAKLTELATGDAISLNGRVEVWELAWRVAMDHPLFGIGYYNLRYFVMTAFNWSGTAHNSLLEVLASTGIPGAALFLGFGLIWLTRVVSSRDGFLLALTPILLIEGNLNSILFVPSSAFLLLLLPLLSPVRHPSLAGAGAVLHSSRRATSTPAMRSAWTAGR